MKVREEYSVNLFISTDTLVGYATKISLVRLNLFNFQVFLLKNIMKIHIIRGSAQIAYNGVGARRRQMVETESYTNYIILTFRLFILFVLIQIKCSMV